MKKIFRIILGTEQLGGIDWGDYSVKSAEKAFLHGLDRGVKTIDTANIYGLGSVEKKISKILGNNINKFNIITKIGISYVKTINKKRAETYKNLSYDSLKNNITSSLKNLKLETIDTCLAHWPDGKNSTEQVIHNLMKIKKEGYVKNIGLSNFNNEDVIKYKKHISHFQTKFSILDKDKIKALKNNEKYNFTTSLYGILAHGLLSGKYTYNRNFKQNDRRYRLNDFSKIYINKNFYKINLVNDFAIKMNISAPSLVIYLTLKIFKKNKIIIGFKNIDQLNDLLNFEDISLDLEKEKILIKKITNS